MSPYSLTRSRALQYTGILLALAILATGYWYIRSEAAQTVTTGSGTSRPDFEAPLTTSLDLARGIGIPTFSRSDGGVDRRATVTDFEGLIKSVRSGEARFTGARRVENLLGDTERLDYNQTWSWYQANGATVTADTVAAPDGTMTADTVAFGTDADARLQSRISGTAVGRTYVFSLWLRAPSATSVELYITDEVSPFLKTIATVSVSNAWQRFSVTRTVADAAATSELINLGGLGSATTVYAWGGQVEEVTGQANQNPSEYVSNDVKTLAPYHGANVDNVKYFATENGNTVASNVVTEATGPAIPDATLRGYLAEGTRTNIVLRSEEFNDASWTVIDTTVTADNAVAPNGRTVAELVTEGSAGTAQLYQAITISASTQYTESIYIKRGNHDWVRVLFTTSGNQVYMFVNLNTGVIGTTGANGTATYVNSSIQSVGNGWYRVTLTGTQPSTDGFVQILSATADGNSTRVNGATHYLWGAQLEQASFASSYIPTMASSVTRSIDDLKYSGADNFNDTSGTVSVDVTTNWSGGAGFDAIFTTNSIYGASQRMSIWHWNGSPNHLAVDRNGQGVRNNYDNSALPITAGTPMRLAQRWSSTANSLFRDGALRGSDSTLSLPYDPISGIGVGYYDAFATIKNVRSWKQAMSDTFLNNLTAGQSGTAKASTIQSADTTGLIGYWSFEDGAGTQATDFSGSGSTGTLTNSPTWTEGKVGRALDFDGVDEYVGVPGTSYNPPQKTVTAWVYPRTTGEGSFGAIFGNNSVGGGWQFTLCDGDSLECPSSPNTLEYYDDRATTPGIWYAPANSVKLNEWNHVAMAYDNGSVSNDPTFYVNGVAVETHEAQAPVGTLDIDTVASIGRLNIGPEFNFDGKIDEVRVYNRVLSPAEIRALYDRASSATKLNVSQNTRQTSGLVGLWSFNGPDVSGTTASDRSGNGNHGTLTNGPVVTEGKVGQALFFDGTNDYVLFSGSATLKPALWTASAWIYAKSGAGNYRAIFHPSFSNGYDGGFLMLVDGSGYFAIRYGTGSGYVGSVNSSVNVLGAWHHVAGTFDGTTLAVYVDGTLRQSANASTFGYLASGDPSRVGISGGTSNFDGSIDEVRLYSSALSASEIAALYNMGR